MRNKTTKRKERDRGALRRPHPSPGTSAQGAPKEGPNPQGKRVQKLVYLLPVLGVLIVILFFVFFRGKAPIERAGELNVLLITLDTTRPDRIGCFGYRSAKTPSLDFLASNGVKFLNAYCQVPLTLPSHSSLMTGTYPLYHKVRNNGTYLLSQDLVTLAEILKQNGFKTAAFVSSYSVDSRYGLDQGFEVYDDKLKGDKSLEDPGAERRAEATVASFADWLDANGRQKYFCWVHFYDPHLPYDPPSPFKDEFLNDPYDGEIAYMDVSIGKIIDKLKQKGQFGNTMIIIAGDHGEALGEKRELDHGIYIYDVTMRVPFILFCEEHLPRGIAVVPRVRLIDVMPTVLEFLKLPAVKQVQGISLLDHIRGKRNDDLDSYIETYYPRENYHWSELIGLIDGDWKYIRAPREELYDLKRDPREETNEIHREEKISSDMRRKLDTVRRLYSSRLEAGKTMTAEEKEKLRSLGYLGTESPAEAPGEVLPDPKDKIEEFHAMSQAKIHEFDNDLDKAAEGYRSLVASYPLVPDNYVNLANLHMRMGDFEQAAQVLIKGIEKVPDASALHSKLGIVYFKLGRLEQALAEDQVALGMNPLDYDALLSSGWILSRSKDYEAAIGYFQKALEIDPGNRSLRMDYAQALAAVGRFSEALEIFGNLKNEYPKDYEIYEASGIILASTGNVERALEDLGKAVGLNPSADTYLNYAAILERAGNTTEAVKYLKLYLQTTTEGDTQRKAAVQKALAHLERTEPKG